MIDELLAIEGVTDILINGPDDVWVDRGHGLETVELEKTWLQSREDVRALALDLARKANARLDDAQPIVDAQLPNGTRLNAVLAPVCETSSGALISLRVHPKHIYTLDELYQKEMFDDQQFYKLKRISQSKKNVVISGETGSGKTTLLAAMLAKAPSNERIVGIEEAKELENNIHPGLILLSARKPNSEGAGEIKLSQLLKTTLRMRPDRVVLGECRGDEVREFLLTLGAGYSGSYTTIHANTAGAVRDRIKTLAFMSGVYSKLAKNQFDQYVDVVIHLRKTSKGRRVEEILEIRRDTPLVSTSLAKLVQQPAICNTQEL